jgi:nitrate reductase / nitrite oxidoreductase, beta subunit
MPKVFNWQLNREMEYPYEGKRPDRQFAIVFNINRCIGCQTCTMACRNTWTFSPGQENMWWNNVETKPYGGYPLNWDKNLIQLLGPQEWTGDTYTGETIFEKVPEGKRVLGYLPSDEDWATPNTYEDTPAGEFTGETELPEHKLWMFYLQRTCNHCTYPGCLAACPRQAIYKRPEDGVVLVDQTRCRGYRECVAACPYKKAMYRPTTRVTEKCIACFPRNDQDLGSRCVVACVGKIRMQGWLNGPDTVDTNNPLDYMVHEAKIALPLYPQFGTEPNLYYIPPRWAPRKFLTQLFGPGVEEAIEKYTNPDKKLYGLLRLFGATEKIIWRFRVTETEAIGYDRADREMIRVALEEPTFVRPEYDEKYAVHRLNEP